MKYSILKVSLFVGILTLSLQGAGQTKYYSDKKESYIEYSMNHPLHSWTGKSSDFTSVIVADETKTKISQVAVSAKISSFDSKNANRDSHAIEVLEAIKYPSVTFASSSVVPSGQKLTVTGALTFHGVTRTITFEATELKKGNSVEISGAFAVNMTDYKIERPSLMGFPTEDEIKISFKAVY